MAPVHQKSLVFRNYQLKPYPDMKFKGTKEEFEKMFNESSTIYFGKLSLQTTEEQLFELCSSFGIVKTTIMGLNRFTKTPTGFCFVEFFSRNDALEAMSQLQGVVVDSQALYVALDVGFYEGRQYGRGTKGGQTKVEMKSTLSDPNVSNSGGNRLSYKRKSYGNSDQTSRDLEDRGWKRQKLSRRDDVGHFRQRNVNNKVDEQIQKKTTTLEEEQMAYEDRFFRREKSPGDDE